MINLKQAMETIRTGEWIQIRFITADLNKKTGGKVIEFIRCRIARRGNMEQAGATVTSASDTSRNPNHNSNFTVNVELPNGDLRKVHPILITHLNKIPVI